MRQKLLTIRKALSNFIHTRNYSNIGRPPRCDAHMNELPIPCVPWQPWYKDKQSYYSKFLAVGALWFLFSFGMMVWTNSMYLNWKAPPQPGPPSDMVEECDDTE